MSTKWSKHLPFLTADEHRTLALALSIPAREVISTSLDDYESDKVIFQLHEAGWLDFRTPDWIQTADGDYREPPGDEKLVGFIASTKLRDAPWAQTLIDNPFPD